MPNKMLIDATHPEETRVVVVRGNRVEEFDFESANRKQLRGNIYLAKVTRVEPSLQAAFVDYGGNRHGFLAFSEIHPDYYQIPVADRQALIDEEERAARAADAEADNRARRGGSHRSRPARRADEEVTGEVTGSHDDHPEAEHHDDRQAGAAADDADATAGVSDAGAAGSEDQAADAHADHHDHAEPDAATGQTAPQTAIVTLADLDQISARTEAEDAHRGEDDHSPNAADASDRADESYPADTTASDDNDRRYAETSTSDDRSDDDTRRSASTDDASSYRGSDDTESSSHDQNDNDDHHADSDGSNITEINGNGAGSEEEVIESVGGSDAMEEVPERMPRLRRQYKIQEVIKRRQVMLVQVVKEERGTKGAALTTYLSLAGRYSVLMPNTARGGGISRKITSSEDRRRLKEVAQELEVPEGMGVILRTAGANRTKPEIKRDFEYLLRLWENVRDLTLNSTAPTLVYEEGSLVKRSIRDLYNKDIDEVLVAGDDSYRDAKEFMRMLMPSHAKNVKLFRDTLPMFTRFSVESQLDAMFQPVVQLRSGGYIVMNQTEALVAIDVNSGRATREHHIEDTALKTNCEAAEEVARQLRLRDLAGLIVIDFIDMDEKRNNRTVERRLKEALKHDRARIQVGHISHFGLLEMSRQRIRSSVLESSTEKCPHCGGTGHLRSVSSVSLQLLRALEEMLLKGATHNITVRTRTDIALYLLNQKRAHLRVLEERFQISIMINADATIGGQVSYLIEKTDLVHTVEQARVIAASQPTTLAPSTIDDEDEDEDAFEDEDDNTAEGTAAPETEQREAALADGDSDHEGGSEGEGEGGEVNRRRRRRRRGRRGEGRENADATGLQVASDAPSVDGDGEAESGASDEAVRGADASAASDGDDASGSDDETAGEASADGDSESERRRRRRGRRGGRRNRRGREGAEGDGLQPSSDAEAFGADAAFDGPPNGDGTIDPHAENGHDSSEPKPEAASASESEPDLFKMRASETAGHEVAGRDPSGAEPAPAETVPAGTAGFATTDTGTAEPVPAQLTSEAHEPLATSEEPAPAEPAPAEPVAARRRRSTVREPASVIVGSEAAEPAAAAEPAPVEPPQPVVTSTAAEAVESDRPRRSGWWSRRVLGKG
jgi:ribonuclease E